MKISGSKNCQNPTIYAWVNVATATFSQLCFAGRHEQGCNPLKLVQGQFCYKKRANEYTYGTNSGSKKIKFIKKSNKMSVLLFIIKENEDTLQGHWHGRDQHLQFIVKFHQSLKSKE